LIDDEFRDIYGLEKTEDHGFLNPRNGNKSIDADENTITNIDISAFKD
jgi:hypothetical protein